MGYIGEKCWGWNCLAGKSEGPGARDAEEEIILWVLKGGYGLGGGWGDRGGCGRQGGGGSTEIAVATPNGISRRRKKFMIITTTKENNCIILHYGNVKVNSIVSIVIRTVKSFVLLSHDIVI